jgi:hypothetical protein
VRNSLVRRAIGVDDLPDARVQRVDVGGAEAQAERPPDGDQIVGAGHLVAEIRRCRRPPGVG